MRTKFFRITVLALAGVMLLALPATSQEDRPDDEPPTADDDGGDEAGGGVTTDGEQIDDFVNVNNPDGNGLTRVNLNSDGACCTDAWRLVNNSDAANRFELREGSTTLRMVMEQSTGDLGLGTDNPTQRLHVQDSGGFQVNLDDGSGNEYIQDAFGSSFRIGHTGTRRQFRIFGNDAPNDALVVADGVGLGTTSPVEDLDVRDINGDGSSKFALTTGGETWRNGVTSVGFYQFGKTGTGGAEIIVRERQHPSATLDVDGPIRATAFNTASSKEFKTNARPVQASDALTKLNELDIKSWQFKACNDGEGRLPREDGTQPPPCSGEGVGPRHVGPMAEDFNAVFGLGDGESIATVDADGVMMAAIQSLTQQLENKDEAISELEGKVSDLEARLQTLEAQTQGDTPGQGGGLNR